MRRVVVTGMAGISPLGCDWGDVRRALRAGTTGVTRMPEWAAYRGLNTLLGAPAAPFDLPAEDYPRKALRAMGRVSLMAVRASDLALRDAGLRGHAVLGKGLTGVAFGSSAGSPEAVGEFARMLLEKSTEGLTATTYLRMMPHTTAVSVAVYFGLKGRVYTTSSACTSGSQAIGYAYEAIRSGRQTLMLAGGSDELSPAAAAVFDTLFATSVRNDDPLGAPRPFDRDRDGLVVGEGAATLVLEDLEHALARGARIHAELVGFGTNCDGAHVTSPEAATMAEAMRLALKDADLGPAEVGFVNAHGTATDQGDITETAATAQVFGRPVPIASLKSYMGHTLGACGALEAWMGIGMLNEGWVAPTLHLDHPDERCAPLDYVRGSWRPLETGVMMTNNFAFGGINTSLIFKRWR